MLKIFTIPVLALGLAFGGAAKPAQALTAEETAALIAGLAIVGVIASSNKSRASNSREVKRPRYEDTTVTRKHSRNRVLPASCLTRVDTDRGPRSLAGQRCLSRNDVHVSRLPDRCEVRVRTNRGLRTAFRQRCLEREGYVFRNGRARNAIGPYGVERTRDGRVILDARR